VATIALGSDHAAVALRSALADHLRAAGWTVEVYGPGPGERSDYPDSARDVAERVARGDAERGILCCGTGIGMSIAANKVPGVRAALVHDPVTATLAAEHNSANVLCLGARLLAVEYALGLADAWLGAAFDPRHAPRLAKIAAMEG